jgi:hypothetical protein
MRSPVSSECITAFVAEALPSAANREQKSLLENAVLFTHAIHLDK